VSAYGAAATCLLSSRDTVYCVLPLHHPAGILVAVGGAMVGRSRLAISRGFDPGSFWPEVRRYGATVCFYAGEMWRELVEAPPSPSEGNHSLRLIAGSGMRADLWQRIHERFGPLSIREFYASTEGNLVLANIAGKAGALGRPLPGSNELAIVAYDFDSDDFVRDAQGCARRCRVDEAGLLIAKVDATHPGATGHDQRDGSRGEAFQRSVFGKADSWFVTGDIVRRDADGDIWYVDRTNHLIRGPHGWIASRQIEDALYALGGATLVVVYGLDPDTVHASLRPAGGLEGRQVVVATLVVPEPERFDPGPISALVAELRPEQRPTLLRLRESLAMTDGFRPLKTPLRAEGVDPEDPLTLRWDPNSSRYIARSSAGS
jgi:putative long chain acyl-CoA synthase